jgi:hypothetical protein
MSESDVKMPIDGLSNAFGLESHPWLGPLNEFALINELKPWLRSQNIEPWRAAVLMARAVGRMIGGHSSSKEDLDGHLRTFGRYVRQSAKTEFELFRFFDLMEEERELRLRLKDLGDAYRRTEEGAATARRQRALARRIRAAARRDEQRDHQSHGIPPCA